jgi:hypothetical protein|tara:strand:- start:104 stop:394 length:291 start_codon:yes stop_codon:yes gene_type:complete
VHDEWLNWIKTHIIKVLNTGKFTSAKLTEVLVEEEMGGKTYSIQYAANSREDLENYYKFNAPKLQSESLKRFADKMLTFKTELKIVEEFYPTSVRN